MYAGEVVEQATTAELFANMKMPYTQALLNSIPNIEMKSGARLQVIEGRLPNQVDRPKGCGFVTRCTYAQQKCHDEHPPLVDAGNGHLYRCWYPLGHTIGRKP
ncbi:MAG: oligopeptide/dipeptide ABC transporter ATP-binding protein [Actinomycetota bacterium]